MIILCPTEMFQKIWKEQGHFHNWTSVSPVEWSWLFGALKLSTASLPDDVLFIRASVLGLMSDGKQSVPDCLLYV